MSSSDLQEQVPVDTLNEHPSIHIAETACRLYGPWCPDWEGELSTLYGHADSHYRRIEDTNPIMARYRIARSLHQAALAPLVHYAEMERVEAMLPYIDCRELFDQKHISFDTIQKMLPGSAPGMYAGYRDAWQQEATWGLGAAERMLQKLEADPQHPVRPAWEAFCAVLPEFSEAESQVRFFKRTQDPRESLAANNAETFESGMVVVMPRALQLRITGLSGRDLAQKMLTESEQLAWASSVGRQFDNEKLRHSEAGCPYAEIPIFNTPDNPRIWALKSLSTGPWKIRRFCPATIELKGNNEAAQQVIDRLYAVKERDSGYSDRAYPQDAGFYYCCRTADHHASILVSGNGFYRTPVCAAVVFMLN